VRRSGYPISDRNIKHLGDSTFLTTVWMKLAEIPPFTM
jgi:hypothetical protein